jgi:hypothetical protein
MPLLTIDLSDPLVQPSPQAAVVGVIRLSGPENFKFHSLDAELIGRDASGAVMSRQSATLRMAGMVHADTGMRVPFRFAFPDQEALTELTWEVQACLGLREQPAVSAQAKLGQAREVIDEFPPLTHARNVGPTFTERIEKVAKVPFTAFFLAIGIGMLTSTPDAPLGPFAIFYLFGANILLMGVLMWAMILSGTPHLVFRFLSTALSLLLWGFALQQVGLLQVIDLLSPQPSLLPGFFAQNTPNRLAWAACLPSLTMLLATPWIEPPEHKQLLSSSRFILHLNLACLLPIALLQAPAEWMNPLYLASAINLLLLSQNIAQLPWQHLTQPWIFNMEISSVPSVMGLLVWEPVHGWKAAIGLVVLIGVLVVLAFIHRQRHQCFGLVRAQLLPATAVRCERVSLLVEMTPPKDLEILYFKAMLSCAHHIQGNLSPVDLRQLSLPMQGEWQTQLPADQACLLVLDAIIPHDAPLTEQETELGATIWKVEAWVKAAGGQEWRVELPLAVVG